MNFFKKRYIRIPYNSKLVKLSAKITTLVLALSLVISSVNISVLAEMMNSKTIQETETAKNVGANLPA